MIKYFSRVCIIYVKMYCPLNEGGGGGAPNHKYIHCQKIKKCYTSLKDLNMPRHYISTWDTIILGSAQTRALFVQLYYHGISVNTNNYRWGYVTPWKCFRRKWANCSKFLIHMCVSWWPISFEVRLLDRSFNQIETSN